VTALSTHAVGEAYAYVQGAILKAYAVFLVRLLNSPITTEEGLAVKAALITASVLMCAPVMAVAQDGATAPVVSTQQSSCAERQSAGEIKNRVDLMTCLNDALTVEAKAKSYPFMAGIYRFEGAALQAAADADAGRISQDEYVAKVKVAELSLQSDAAAADEATTKAKQKQADDDAYAAARQKAYQAQQAQAAEHQRRASIIGMMIGNNNAAAAAQQQNLRQLQQNLSRAAQPAPSVNCTTIYVGDQAQTHCQ
jgi:hypothetical protein